VVVAETGSLLSLTAMMESTRTMTMADVTQIKIPRMTIGIATIKSPERKAAARVSWRLIKHRHFGARPRGLDAPPWRRSPSSTRLATLSSAST
jgi:hypothetical protein